MPWNCARPIGSVRIDRDGYRRVKVVYGKGKWVYEHVIVAEEMLGRPLTSDEIVHHINGKRADNRRENLFVCRDRAHHNEVHRSQDRAFRALLDAGHATFKDGVYAPVF